MRLHLDTDLGSNPDDACALTMLLGMPDVEITGITTTIDPAGARAGLVHKLLSLAGRDDVPVAAGAAVSLTTRRTPGAVETGAGWWPRRVPPRPSPPGAALDLLGASLGAGATVAAIGPCTNLALLETLRPGSLASAPIVLMGGWIGGPLPGGFPPWEADRDWNVQCDTQAARVVVDAAADLTLVPIATTVRVPVREADLPRMRAAGVLGRLLARQTERYGGDRYSGVGPAHPALPDDLLNFHHDPLACAVAAGWAGVHVADRHLVTVEHEGVLRLADSPVGRPVRVVDGVDTESFRDHWFRCLERACGGLRDAPAPFRKPR